MRVVFDPEIHSKYARAVSRECTPANLAHWARKKGISVLGTGDFTHPLWMKDLKSALTPAEEGLFQLKHPASEGEGAVRFMLSGEVSCVYTKGGRGRRVHHLIFAPSFEVAEKINKKLSYIGNLKSDGRPIIGLPSKELLKIVRESSRDAYLVPAHVWTPWFGIFGSKSGYNSLEECFDELTGEVFAVETGLSSDPAMNWRISFLDDKAIISGSDAHSLSRLGREATVLDLSSLSYRAIFDAIKTCDPRRFSFTLEFFPEEGRYHYDGHRDQRHSQSPEETEKHNGLCAKCGHAVTVGVMARVQELAAKDRPEGWQPPKARIPFKNMIPLDQIIADAFGVSGVASKRVRAEYERMVATFGNEFSILLDAGAHDLRALARPEVAEAILRVRDGKVEIRPGYDGEYGKIKIFDDSERKEVSKQAALFS